MEQTSITLPEQVIEATITSPKVLVLYSLYKVGKTSLAAQLKGNLLIDLEDGSDAVSALKIKARKYQDITLICEEVDKKGNPYKYATIDTVSALEDFVIPLALKLYQKTQMGQEYKGDILSLPKGAGYLYLRQAFEMMVNRVRRSFERVILLGHVKDKLIESIAGKEVEVKALDLTGKLSSMTCAKADAVGYVWREGNKNMVTFANGSGNVIVGARPQHLKNKSFMISEEQPDGKLTTFWDKIYID